jgi:hypothetical protein
MLQEESFHLGTGRTVLKEIAQMAARGEGDYSIEDVQRAINLWFPRGLEMFGSEDGGATAVTFGFKDKTNAEAQSLYVEEVRGVVANINVAIAQERIPGISRQDARAVAEEIERTGDPRRGLGPADILFLPDVKFFRRRGRVEYVFKPFDVRGNLLTEDGKPYSPEKHLQYLKTVLPERFIGTGEYEKFVDAMREYLGENR